MAAALFDYVGTLYSSRIEASNDPSSLLAVYRALVRHLAVFGVEIADPALYPQLIAEYATPAEGAAAAGRGDDVIDGLLSVRLAARRVKRLRQG
jgi:cysteinyl-tRNA synthetase